MVLGQEVGLVLGKAQVPFTLNKTSMKHKWQPIHLTNGQVQQNPHSNNLYKQTTHLATTLHSLNATVKNHQSKNTHYSNTLKDQWITCYLPWQVRVSGIIQLML